jgi:hypothetical protein
MSSTNLHVYYLQRNITAFKKYLDGTEQFETGTGGSGSGKDKDKSSGSGSLRPGSSSGPRSWTLNQLNNAPKRPDPNVRDALGRTVLHLICSTTGDQRSYDYLSILLHHPQIQINLQDIESGWTALHRSLWVGNLRAARELMGRNDIDLGLKDYEGFTAFDVFNSTCEGTNPVDGARGTDLYTWGSNRNYTLGSGDATDRALPERVNLLNQVQARSADASSSSSSSNYPVPLSPDGTDERELEQGGSRGPGSLAYGESTKFDRVGVEDVVMAKFHTGVLTSEKRSNLSLTGFGSNGR